MKHLMIYGLVCIIGSLALGVPGMIPRADAYQVNLSLYNQGFNINNFYNDGEFDVEKGIVEADPSSLLIIVGDPANVETTLNIPDIPDPFELADAGSDFHFEIAQPFRFQDRFDGLFSTTVDDPVLFVPDNGTITAFRDDGILADDRIDLNASERELPPMYVEVDYGDTITMTTRDNTRLFITQIWRNPDFSVSFDISDVPEPGTAVLLGLGVVGMIGILRRKKIKLNKIAIVFICFLFMGLSFTETEAYAYAPGEGAPMMVGFFDFPKSAIIGAFSRNAANLGVATDVAKNVQGRIYQQTFEKGIILFKGGLTAYAVHGKIYEKWVALGAENSKLGYPVKEEVGAWGSPQGTGGKVQFFENGDIYWAFGTNEAFEIRGAILGVFNGNNGTGEIGYPLTDEIPNGPFGNAINYFEGEHCITSQDGREYELFDNCVQGGQRPTTKLIEADARCVAVDSDAGVTYVENMGNFKLTYDNYTPKNPIITFSPDLAIYVPPLNEVVRRAQVTVTADGVGITTNSVQDELLLVREDYTDNFEIELDMLSSVEDLLDAIDDIMEYASSGSVASPCDFDEPGVGISPLSWETSTLCCPDSIPCIKNRVAISGGINLNAGGVTCDFPFAGVPYVATLNATINTSVGISAGISDETTCDRDKFCGYINPKIEVGGGVSGILIHRNIARTSLTLQARQSVGDSELCYTLGKGLCAKFTPSMKFNIVGDIKLFSFISKSVEATIAEKEFDPVEMGECN